MGNSCGVISASTRLHTRCSKTGLFKMRKVAHIFIFTCGTNSCGSFAQIFDFVTFRYVRRFTYFGNYFGIIMYLLAKLTCMPHQQLRKRRQIHTFPLNIREIEGEHNSRGCMCRTALTASVSHLAQLTKHHSTFSQALSLFAHKIFSKNILSNKVIAKNTRAVFPWNFVSLTLNAHAYYSFVFRAQSPHCQ